MHASIISIGDELTLGQNVDTNSAWLSQRLVRLGIMPVEHITVPDHEAMIRDAFARAIERADLVLATGGLGPTDDDLTRQALASLMGAELVLYEPSLKAIEAFFAERRRPMAAKNRIQAMMPAGAKSLDNPFGTAPGIYAEIDGRHVFCVPGVPVEMRGLWTRHIEPFLTSQPVGEGGGRFILTAKLNTFGMGESNVAELLGDLMRRDRNPMVGTTVSESIIAVRIRSEARTLDEARQALDLTIAECRGRLGDLVFGVDSQTLPEAIVERMKTRRLTLATAESCTGGLVAKMMTDQPGSSEVFVGGWVTYANAMKQRQIHVSEAVLTEHGAVSEAVAIAMAEGARREADTDYALSITGIAGPTGATPGKPVGLVWIALADRKRPMVAQAHHFPGDRPAVRDRAAKTALNMLRLRLLEETC